MNIWITRHGQTKLNKTKLMQGRTDEPLNERGREQARLAHEGIGDVKFDAVYASPLDRAIETASIIAGVSRDEVIVEPRIIEADFGRFEMKPYAGLGFKMTAYWMFPELFKNPEGVESIESMVTRSHGFLKELEEQEYENVLVVCHGGIIRAMCGYLEDKKSKIKWRPKPHNCEIRVYESRNAEHKFVKSYRIDK